MTAQAVRITDDTTPEELAEAITQMCAWAKRQQRLIAQFDADDPTDWDKAHRRMDGPLDDYLAAIHASS
jgi:hypothetical protein